MLTFKCKMCGGTLEIQPGATVAECEYCGASQTLPKLDDEKRMNLYDRANHFRRSNDFDKACSIYEQILNEDNTDAEAYWSLVLCRYGIEYVEDPISHRRLSTVNRAQFTSIFDDENYKSALAHSDSYQRVIYENEAKAINEIQKGILAISSQEEPFEVFICYKETDANGRRTHDSVLANDLYHNLVNEGFKVFFSRITLEDKLGTAYEPYIFAALHSATVMVVIGTKPEYFNAVWVKNEWSRFLGLIKSGDKKILIPAYRDMDPYDLPQEFSHLQAQDMSKLGFMQDLIRGIKKILGKDKVYAPPVQERVTRTYEGQDNTAPLLRRAFLFLEDCEYESADEYAERVLDINPECAQAYVVKLLIEYSLKREEDLAGLASPFSTSHNYEKAIRFASSDYRAKLEGYNTAIIDRNDREYKKATYTKALSYMSQERYEGAIDLFESILSYKDSREKISECREILENKRLESIYSRACECFSRALYDDAKDLFVTIPEYRDAKAKATECDERKENARKAAIYSQALARVSAKLANDIALKKSIEELNSISGYSDADEKIRELSLRLDAWYEAKRKAEEAARIKAEEERRARERAEELRKIRIERNKKIAK
ncbi:MAG: TIR domain-containing protein [Clostridia bacterium]|nr:TIR domain-containing protein [Clostridia bacterium]